MDCAFLVLVVVVIGGILLAAILLGLRAVDAKSKERISEVLDAIGGLKQALGTAGATRLSPGTEGVPVVPLQRSTPSFPPAAPAAPADVEEPPPESGRATTLAVTVYLGGEAVELDAETAALLAEMAISKEEIPGLVKQLIDRGLPITEKLTGLSREDKGEDETSRRRAGLYPVVQVPEPPAGEEPTVDEEERTTLPEESGPITPPKK